MKALAYAIFVISVLLVSGFARADLLTPFMQQATYQTPIQIKAVSVAEEGLLLMLQGTLPNPCFQQPAASLTPDSKEPNTLVLRLSSPYPMGTCVQRIKPYSTVVDLPALAQTAQLQLEDKAVYVIKTEGYDFQMQVVGSDLLN